MHAVTLPLFMYPQPYVQPSCSGTTHPLQHPRVKHMQATVRENFYWPKLTTVKKYGKIPLPVNTKVAPWEEVHVNLVGPWVVCFNSTSVPGKATIEKIHALTVIDKATEWPEFLAIHNKSGYHVSVIFDSQWLCHYT
jgi:hypothetical protein